MSIKDKLITRFLNQPKDFTFDELTKLFTGFGFKTYTKGKTSGSRIQFLHEEKDLSYLLHKPHPSNVIKNYVVKQVLEYFIDNEFIKMEE